MDMDVLVSLAVVVGAAAVGGVLARMLRLPALVGYLGAGMALNMAGVGSGGLWSELGKVGVTFLLFLVGLELPINDLRKYGKTALLTGSAQIGITSIIGFGLARWLGFGFTEAVAFLAVKGLILVAGTLVLAETVLPKIMAWMARSVEGLYVFSLAWCLGVAAVVGSRTVGFSVEIGGLLAGLALAAGAQRLEIMARIRPLRDFFMVLFFVSGRRTAFLAGLTMGQISEFSLVVAAAAVATGLVGPQVLGVVTVVGVISMTVCSLAMTYAKELYTRVGRYLPGKKSEKRVKVSKDFGHVILFGHNRTGSAVRPVLEKMGKKVLVVDFNPMIVDKLKGEGVDVVYGDLADAEIYDGLGLDRADLVISTVSDVQDNLLLLEKLKQNVKRKVVVTAGDDQEARELYNAGADFVLVPHRVGGEYLAHLLERNMI
ncbi:MAG: sodium/hydrogen exchanger [Microgenomates group bacterium Gr01-1014_16]|nr:MAG: sodium/hydrogen exchanger [Microgenomates group bacterium Gr01-1014_16]